MMTSLNAVLKALSVVALSLLAAGNPGSLGETEPPSAAFSVNTVSPAAGTPVEFAAPASRVGSSAFWDFGDGSTSADPRPLHVYGTPGEYPVTLTVASGQNTSTSSRILSVTASQTLTLLAGPPTSHPFNLTLTATDPRTGNTGPGEVVMQNDIYGIFSVPSVTGNAGNPEIIVKMVDATGIGQSYWVFYGALTDMVYTLTVRDSVTGATKTYHEARVGTTVCGKFDLSGFAPGAGSDPAGWTGLTISRATSGEDTLTLNSAHSFNITLSASDPRTGKNGDGQVLAHNDVFGIFSISSITGNADNPEVIVKIVDASALGLDYWVFYSALTDLNYSLLVKENATGKTKTYQNIQIGTTVCGALDVSGFQSVGASPTPPATPTPTPPAPTPTPTVPSGTTRIVNVGAGGNTAFRDTVSNTSTTTIHVGDTVQWNFVSATSHSATSGTCTNGDPYGPGYSSCDYDGNFDSGVQVSPATFSKKFTVAGSFPYYCSVHGSMMTGLVAVLP